MQIAIGGNFLFPKQSHGGPKSEEMCGICGNEKKEVSEMVSVLFFTMMLHKHIRFHFIQFWGSMRWFLRRGPSLALLRACVE